MKKAEPKRGKKNVSTLRRVFSCHHLSPKMLENREKSPGGDTPLRVPEQSQNFLQSFPIDHSAENGHEHDLDIQPKGPVLDVPNIMLDALGNAGVSAKAVHLRPAGHTWSHLVLHHVERHRFSELLHKEGDFRARTHQAHVAADHVPQLRQLVQAQLSQEAPDPRATVIVVRGPCGVLRIIDLHAPEFQHHEITLALFSVYLCYSEPITSSKRFRPYLLLLSSNPVNHALSFQTGSSAPSLYVL